MTARCILRRTSEVIANFLPPKGKYRFMWAEMIGLIPSTAEYVVFIAPTQLQRDIYNAVLGSSQVRQVLNGGANGLQLITILKKVTNTPGILLRDKDAVCPAFLTELAIRAKLTIRFFRRRTGILWKNSDHCIHLGQD